MTTGSAYRFLDVGGSFIKCDDGRVIPVRSAGSREEIAASLREAVKGPAGHIGIAIPGPFDFENGIFRMTHKFASVYGEGFRKLAAIPDGVEVRYHHDVNALLLGCIRRMGLTGNTALVTLGTGLGFTYSIAGAVQYGPGGSPARHLYNLPWGDGILEDRISARGIRDAYAARTGDTTASVLTIAQRARGGDLAALETFSEMGTLLGEVLPDVLEELETDTLVLSGQISKSLKLFERPLLNGLEGLPLKRVVTAPEGAVFDGLTSLFGIDYL